MLEIDKIKDHSDVSGLNIDESFKKCVDSGLIFQDAKDVVFELVNQVMLNNKAKAFELLKEFNEFTDSHLGFLALLYSNFRQLLLVQGLGDKNNIAERTGLTGFQVRMALNRFGSYRLQEIMEALKMLQFMDKAIKTGIVEPKRAGELILCLVMR
jgi:DNA polymerase III delta subunit